MQRFSMEKLGAGLGIATGVAFIPIAAFGGLFLLLFGVTEFGGSHAIKPLIGPGWSGVLYAIAVLTGGLLALRWPRLGGVVLLSTALVGLLFGTSRYLVVESLSLIAAVLCLIGWWKHRSAPRVST